jgi:hypothetical protein
MRLQILQCSAKPCLQHALLRERGTPHQAEKKPLLHNAMLM